LKTAKSLSSDLLSKDLCDSNST